jgi:hypothetical protein
MASPSSVCDDITKASACLALSEEQQPSKQALKQQVRKTMRVRFAPFISQRTLPEDAYPDEDSNDELWYSKEVLHKLALADVHAIKSAGKTGTDASTTTTQPSSSLAVDSRGLEAHITPGELIRRQRFRKHYVEALFRKRETLLVLCGENRNEVAERLEKFLTAKSKPCREQAQALGVQDAIDARSIYRENAALTELISPAVVTEISAHHHHLHMSKQMRTAIHTPVKPRAS